MFKKVLSKILYGIALVYMIITSPIILALILIGFITVLPITLCCLGIEDLGIKD